MKFFTKTARTDINSFNRASAASKTMKRSARGPIRAVPNKRPTAARPGTGSRGNRLAKREVPKATKERSPSVNSSGSKRQLSSFGRAFRDASNAGVETFKWHGKSYTTERRDGSIAKGVQRSRAIRAKQQNRATASTGFLAPSPLVGGSRAGSMFNRDMAANRRTAIKTKETDLAARQVARTGYVRPSTVARNTGNQLSRAMANKFRLNNNSRIGGMADHRKRLLEDRMRRTMG